MSVKTESVYTGEFLVSEGNNTISREQVPFAANLIMEPGTVVGKESATGAFKPLDPSSSAFEKGVIVHTQSNPLPINLRPRAVIKLTMS